MTKYPAYEFEAFNAIRFLDNFLHRWHGAVSGGRSLFGAVGIVASGKDVKADFASLNGRIGDYKFEWDGNTLECISDSRRNFVNRGRFEVDFNDEPCEFLNEIWACPLREARDCVRASVSRLAANLKSREPSAEGGVQKRFDELSRIIGLSNREQDMLMIGLCVSDDMLEFDLSENRRSRFLDHVTEIGFYLGCGADEVMPLVRRNARLIVSGLLNEDLTLSREAMNYLNGLDVVDSIQPHGFLAVR